MKKSKSTAKLPIGPKSAYLFDIEGVLVGSNYFQYVCYKAALEKVPAAMKIFTAHMEKLHAKDPGIFTRAGIKTPFEFSYKHYDNQDWMRSKGRRDAFKGLLGISDETHKKMLDDLYEAKGDVTKELRSKEDHKVLEGTEDTLKALKASGARIAFNTSSGNSIYMLLKQGLLHYFECGIMPDPTGTAKFSLVDVSLVEKGATDIPEKAFKPIESITKGKPDLQTWNYLTEHLQVNPKRVVCFEDSPKVMKQAPAYSQNYAALVGVNGEDAFKNLDPKVLEPVSFVVDDLGKFLSKHLRPAIEQAKQTQGLQKLGQFAKPRVEEPNVEKTVNEEGMHLGNQGIQ